MGKFQVSGRGRRRLLRGHPWIYADDVASGEGEPGELVPVSAPDDRSLGWALFSSHSRIALRLVTRASEQPNRAFWVERVRAAVEHRRAFGGLEPGAACRLLSADADGLPGFLVDRYDDVLVVQSGCQGSDRMRDFLLEIVREVVPFQVNAVLDRSDSATRRHEDLEPRVEWVGAERDPVVEIREEETAGRPALSYLVNVIEGHKTGHYLDQRENRALAAEHAGGRVLDAFSYDGLFGIRAALAGAEEVVCLDQAEAAGERLRQNAERNGVADRVRFEKANAMHDLRRRAAENESYDLVVVDPPAFARNKREAEGALRGYRELNLRAMGLTRPGGVLVSASCSYNVDRGAFLDCLAGASVDAGRDLALFRVTGAAPDHPVRATLPESEYLKCAFGRVR